MLAERGVDPTGEVSETAACEEIVSLVNQFVLQDADEFGAMSEELGGGGGVM
jgi:hypothetical protein